MGSRRFWAIDGVLAGLEGVALDIDDVVVGGETEAEHDQNLKAFLERAKDRNLTMNML